MTTDRAVALPPAWQRHWDVAVSIITTTADGTPLPESVDWNGERPGAARHVRDVGRAWAAQLVGLSFNVGGIQWVVETSHSCFRPNATDDTACFLQLAVADATAAEPLDEDALEAALPDAVLAAIDVGSRRRVEVDGRMFFGQVTPSTDAFCDIDGLLTASMGASTLTGVTAAFLATLLVVGLTTLLLGLR